MLDPLQQLEQEITLLRPAAYASLRRMGKSAAAEMLDNDQATQAFREAVNQAEALYRQADRECPGWDSQEKRLMLARIIVRYDVWKTSENGLPKSHFVPRAKVIADARHTAFKAWEQAGEPKCGQPVVVSAVIRRANRLDENNAVGALKPLIDGIFVGIDIMHPHFDQKRGQMTKKRLRLPGMLPDDNPDYLRQGSVAQETGPEWKGREEVEFRIELVSS